MMKRKPSINLDNSTAQQGAPHLIPLLGFAQELSGRCPDKGKRIEVDEQVPRCRSAEKQVESLIEGLCTFSPESASNLQRRGSRDSLGDESNLWPDDYGVE
jgi:hypothetical protein